jgi:hypothetical protein
MQRLQHRLRWAGACALLSLGALSGCSSDSPSTDVNANQAPPTTDPNERDRIEKGIQIAPVAPNLTNKDRDLVGLGSYIVNAQAGCNLCHTNPPYAAGGDPFQGQPKQVNAAGYLKGGVALGTGRPAPNIRPDANGNPFGLTQDAFIQVIRTGNAGHILQVMPWPVFQDMTDHDLTAVYQYLSALPQQ